jgi:hypothetical protein
VNTTFVDDRFVLHVLRANCETTRIKPLGHIKIRTTGMGALESIQGILSEFETVNAIDEYIQL